MNRPTDPIPPADLLIHAASLRRLAAQLVRDAAQADDLVQRTWLQALTHPPRQRRRLGPWLRTVLRNEARQDHRSDHARRAREQGAAISSPGRTADNVLARSEQLQQLVAAVRALPERDSAPAHRELWFPITQDVTLAPGRTVAVDLVAEPGGRIRLTLNDPKASRGRPLEYQLSVVSPAGEPQRLRSFTRKRGEGWSWGRLRLGTPSVSNDLLEPGGYTLRIVKADAIVAERAFEVGAGEILALTVDLPE